MYKKIKIEEIKDRNINKSEEDEENPIFSNFSSSSENYFQNILKEEEFEGLKRLVEDSDGSISWKKLVIKGVVKIEGEKIEGIYWKGDLDLRGTRVKSLGKLKRVGKGLYCNGVKTLEDLGELEEVEGLVDIRGYTIKIQLGIIKKIKSGKLKVGGLEYDEFIDKIYEGGSLIYEEFENIFGYNIKK